MNIILTVKIETVRFAEILRMIYFDSLYCVIHLCE